MKEIIGTILLGLVLLAAVVILGYLALKTLEALIRSLSGFISILADLVTYGFVLFGLHSVIPLHFSSAFWDWVAYFLVTASVYYYLLKLRLVEYSANYAGVVFILCVVMVGIQSRPVCLAMAILMPVLARLFWISSRFSQGGTYWREDSRSEGISVTKIYGHYEEVEDHDMRVKSEDDREIQDNWMPVQVLVAGVLYFMCTVLSLLMALDDHGVLPVGDWVLILGGVTGAVVNVLIDLLIMKKVDQYIDALDRPSFEQAHANATWV